MIRSPSTPESLEYLTSTSCRKVSQSVEIISHVKYPNLLRKYFQDSKFGIVLFLMICHAYYAHTRAPRARTKELNERPQGAGFRSVNPAERWRENPARALARAGFSQHLECGIHRSESSPEGSFALIPQPVAR